MIVHLQNTDYLWEFVHIRKHQLDVLQLYIHLGFGLKNKPLALPAWNCFFFWWTVEDLNLGLLD